MIYHNIILIFFIRADAEEKYGKALIKLAEGAKGKDEIGYGFISELMDQTEINRYYALTNTLYIIHEKSHFHPFTL